MHIFCVHGYLAPRAVMWPLARRLRTSGFKTTVFGYASHRGTLETHAAALAASINSEAPQAFGIVAHSLGGLVARAALEHLDIAPERLIFLSTPHRGCAHTRRLRESVVARWLSPAVKRTAYGMDTALDINSCGVIVGTRDRLVRADEAFVEGAPNLALPYGHNEILMRPRTAQAVAHFMRHGVFEQSIDLSVLAEQCSAGC